MLPTVKTIVSILDTQASAGKTNTFSFDRLGFNYAIVNVALMGTETTDPPTVLTLTQSDDNTTFGNITGFVGGTDWTNPTAVRTLGNASQGPTIVQLRVALHDKKRYLKVTCNSATKTTQVVSVNLHRGQISPESATNAGVDVLATV